jgi:phosphoserine phosphatase RsbU/P
VSDEEARLAQVAQYLGLHTEDAGVYDQVAALAARLFDAPMAKVTLVGRDDVHLLAAHGFDGGDGRIPRTDAVCELVVSGQVGRLVSDVRAHPRVADRAFVRRWQIRFYACASIVGPNGLRLGTVTVMDTEPRSASDEQLGMLADLAAVVAKQLDMALSSQSSLRSQQRDRDEARRDRDDAQRDRDQARTDRDTAIRDRDSAEQERDLVEAYATTLQSTLLPPTLPRIDGAALAAHFRPASLRHVGGDFYDVFPLADDSWGFFIGDVVGHGVDAAVATSLIRYTLRSASWHYDDPARVLSELNAVMMGELNPRRTCTVITGTIRSHPAREGLYVTLGTGGHQPALLLDADDATAAEIRPSSGMLIGAIDDAEFSSCSVWLRPGRTLLLFTDGIVEARRGEEAFDVDGLAAFARQRAHLSAREQVADLATLATKLEPDDDVAMLVLQASARR